MHRKDPVTLTESTRDHSSAVSSRQGCCTATDVAALQTKAPTGPSSVCTCAAIAATADGSAMSAGHTRTGRPVSPVIAAARARAVSTDARFGEQPSATA